MKQYLVIASFPRYDARHGTFSAVFPAEDETDAERNAETAWSNEYRKKYREPSPLWSDCSNVRLYEILSCKSAWIHGMPPQTEWIPE